MGMVHLKSHTQNLVPNYSFEDTVNAPAPTQELENAEFWINPNAGTPDYFNSMAAFLTAEGVPNNVRGFQYPKTGNAYGGFFAVTQTVFGGALDGKEYIQVKLLSPLIAGKKYKVEFFVNLASISSIAITSIGAYFSNTPINSPTISNFNYIPQLTSDTTVFLRDTLNWIKVSGCFYADGGEEYLTMGNFQNPSDIDTLTMTPTVFGCWCSYYYIDDVSVTECLDTIPPVPPIDVTLMLPNIFTPNGDGINDVLKFTNLPEKSGINIYNRWGNPIFSNDNYKNDWRAEGVTDGIYFYVLKLPTGEIKRGSIQLTR